MLILANMLNLQFGVLQQVTRQVYLIPVLAHQAHVQHQVHQRQVAENVLDNIHWQHGEVVQVFLVLI